MTFAARARRERQLSFAAIAEPVDAEVDAERTAFRRSLAAEFARLIAAAIAEGRLPEQDAGLSAAALTGLLIEGAIGPLAPDEAGRDGDLVQSLALAGLRALGVADARARGLVVQTAIPAARRDALAARARDHFTEQLPGLAVEFHQLHLFDGGEIGGAGRDGDARQ